MITSIFVFIVLINILYACNIYKDNAVVTLSRTSRCFQLTLPSDKKANSWFVRIMPFTLNMGDSITITDFSGNIVYYTNSGSYLAQNLNTFTDGFITTKGQLWFQYNVGTSGSTSNSVKVELNLIYAEMVHISDPGSFSLRPYHRSDWHVLPPPSGYEWRFDSSDTSFLNGDKLFIYSKDAVICRSTSCVFKIATDFNIHYEISKRVAAIYGSEINNNFLLTLVPIPTTIPLITIPTTVAPTITPTEAASSELTVVPTEAATSKPTEAATAEPTVEPTEAAIVEPTAEPNLLPITDASTSAPRASIPTPNAGAIEPTSSAVTSSTSADSSSFSSSNIVYPIVGVLGFIILCALGFYFFKLRSLSSDLVDKKEDSVEDSVEDIV